MACAKRTSNITTEGNTMIQVGDRIMDNDPRMPGRVLVVKAIEGGRAVASSSVGSCLHETRISLKRIHEDGKPRRTGWSLVE